jgi:pyruvate dehydrogenase E2 component (dihydrolipoamide acetyltransferase)
MSSVVWLPILHRLGRLRRTVAIDLPGHGRSPNQAASLSDLLDAVAHAALGLCLGPSILVGHSLGGAVCLAAAGAFGDKVRGLGLVTTAPRLPVRPETFALLESSFARWPEHFAEVAFSPSLAYPERLRAARLALAADQAQTIADYRIADALSTPLPPLQIPTVVVSGAHDLLTPPSVAPRIPHAAQVTIGDCGHMPMVEQPDALVAALVPLIEKIP